MRASLASINDKKLLQGKLVTGSQLLDLGLELALLQRRQLVEQGLDEDGVGSRRKQLQASSENPQIEHKVTTSLLDNLQKRGQNGGHEGNSQQIGLDHIRDEQLGRLLVEAKFFLKHKRVVDACRERKNLLDNNEAENKEDGVADFAGEPSRRPFEEQIAGPGPQLGENIELDKCHILNLGPETGDDFELSFGAPVGLGLVKGFLGYFLGEDGGGLGLLEDTVLAEGKEGLEDVLADGEAENELLPWEEGAIEESRQALWLVVVLDEVEFTMGELLGGSLEWEGKCDLSNGIGDINWLTYLKEIHYGDGS